MTAFTYSRDVSGQMFTGQNVEPFDISFGVCEMRKVSNFNTGRAHARKRADVLAWQSHGCARAIDRMKMPELVKACCVHGLPPPNRRDFQH